MNSLPKRKHNRLPGYDYAQTGAYHVIFCTENHVRILSAIVSDADGDPPLFRPQVRLFPTGETVLEAISKIPSHYPAVSVDNFVIMPNHVHLLLSIHATEEEGGRLITHTAAGDGEGGRLIIAPTVSRVVKQLKAYVTKRCGRVIWQKGFYDHVIKDDADYAAVWTYIDENPSKWENDAYF